MGDVQRGIIAHFGFARQVLPTLERVIPAARAHNVDVIFLRAGFRGNGADVSPRNTLFQNLFDMGEIFDADSPSTAIEPGLGPEEGDTVILKRRTSGFFGTELDLILRSKNIDDIVICGVATGAMVAATVFAASDLDYRIAVLRDGCADGDQSVHDLLMDKLFPSRGVQVLDAKEWIDTL
ncbi:cysteine hydrolase family protein [Rhodococcus koreensis]